MLALKNAAIACTLITAVGLAGCASPYRESANAAASAEQLLPAYHWELEEAKDRYGYSNPDLFGGSSEPFQLRFENSLISVSGACNRLSGPYSIKRNTLIIGDLMQTMMACEQPLMLREASIKDYLNSQLTISLDAQVHSPRLTLTTGDGRSLMLNGSATPETRYGSSGEILYLEVQAQTAQCPHPLIPDFECLQVRELTYDEQGLETSASDWTLLYQGIEGFDHQPGTRNVLRLKRYNIANPPADQAGVAYVLDMVVESVRVMN